MLAPLVALPSADAPKGFAPVDERIVLRKDPNDLSAPGWMVTLEHDRLRVETRVAWVSRDRRESAARKRNPAEQTFRDGMGTLSWRPGEGVRVEDGWLYGYDAGEFGGGLFWFSADGKRRRKVSGRNTQFVLRTPKGVFAVEGLTHLMFWYGRLVQIVRRGDTWTERLVTDLHSSPAVLADGSRFIIANPGYVSTLETDGTQHEIYRGFNDFRIESLVRRQDGEVWIGSSHGLLRLRPKTGGDYTAQWFLPLK